MIFRTVTGSVYEVDGLRARRLSGRSSPTARIGKNLEWRELSEEPQIVVGEPALLLWTDDIDPPAELGVPGTLTSRVVEINYSAGDA